MKRFSEEQVIGILREGEVDGTVIRPSTLVLVVPCQNNASWKGLLITKIAVEVDEYAAFIPSSARGLASPSSAGTRLLSTLSTGKRFMGQTVPVVLVEGVASTSQGISAGFLCWQIVIGQSNEKRVLKVIDLLLKKKLVHIFRPVPPPFPACPLRRINILPVRCTSVQ